MRATIIAFTLFFCSPSMAEVHSFTLDNGLKVLVKEDHRAPVAVSMLWYNIGSSEEQSGKTGLSHALEHLMFKGTPSYPQGVLSNTLASLGAESNAFTTQDYTVYYEKVDASKLETVFALEADRMRNLTFDKDIFEKEIRVIQEERRIRTDNNPQALAFERLLATAHLTMPYQHPVIGWMEDLKSMRIEDLKAWYNQYYYPNNATLVVVGDVNPEEIHQLAQKTFGAIPKGQIPERRLDLNPKPLGKKSVLIHAQAQLPLLLLGYAVPSKNTAKQPFEPYALELIATILDGGDSGRFTKDLIVDKGIASGMGIYYNLYARHQTQLIIFGTPSFTQNMQSLQKGILEQLTRLQKEPLTEKELQKIKNQIIAQKTFEKDSLLSQAMELGLLQTLNMDWQETNAYLENIKRVTPSQIQETAVRYFQENALTQAELIPN
jgi:zinc protease